MNRRTFLAAPVALALVRPGPQDSTKIGAADPLPDPGTVGQLRSVASPTDNDETIKGIERRLKCTCGCNLDIFTCRTTDFTCTYSPALHQEIVALYVGGASGDDIVKAFVAKHGEEILLAPDARGFNLVGYLAPGAAVLLATGVLGFLLLRKHRSRVVATAVAGTSPDLTTDQRSRLEQALREFES